MCVDGEYMMSQKFVINKAVVTDKKSYPNRMMIVVISVICTFALAIVLIICREGIHNFYRQIKA
jgi:uncharacterized protein involved in exopolysaccharide biosynthesis